VIEVHQSQSDTTLWSLAGRIVGDSVQWSSPSGAYYDSGVAPSVAANRVFAVQSHQSQSDETLWSTSSLLLDRANWMGAGLPVIGAKTLGQIALPGAHDAAMYGSGFPESLGETQDLNLYQQLSIGVRYFDLRPGRGGDGSLYAFHSVIQGPNLQGVFNDVRAFMAEGHRELVILKLSHYKDFSSDDYSRMTAMIQQTLGPWLYVRAPGGPRLVDTPLNEYLTQRGTVLVCCDEAHPIQQPSPGIYVYRDWTAPDPERGDLCVYDQYANIDDYDSMKTDQFAKFAAYDGRCQNDPAVPCDLFLLSWTETPSDSAVIPDVWNLSRDANSRLAPAIAELAIPNAHGRVVNIIYVDNVEGARVTDVCWLLDSARPPYARDARTLD
jgi:hypothetical protein